MSIIASLRRLIGKPAMVKITDIPAGRKFIATLTNVATNLARGFVGMSDDQARAKLDEYVDRVRPAVIDALGEENAGRVLPGFRRVVMQMRAKLETARPAQRQRTGARKRYQTGLNRGTRRKTQ
jgi:hypothetical protein